MDITMPVLDGLGSAKEILTADPAARIIMLSAMGDEELMKSAKDMGIRVFLQKPFKAEEMINSIRQVIGS
jgi:two-component system chemotaxis response regulator CheY